MEYYILIILIAALSGFFSGLLGLGGGIIIIPAFLYILPALGYETLSLKEITGVSAMQSFLGGLSAFSAHLKYKLIEKDISFKLAITASIGALTGSVLSGFLKEKVLLIIFAAFLALATVLILKPKNNFKHSTNKKWISFLLSGFIGIVCGALGIGGAVLYIPVLHYFYNLSIKACISNATVLVMATSIFSFIGKTFTNQVPFIYLPFIVIGAFTGAKIGAKINHKLKPIVLKYLLIIVISITLIRILISIFN